MSGTATQNKDKPEGYLFGRPTKYDPSYCLLAEEYVKECVDEWDEYHKTRGEKSDSYERTLKVNLPTHEGFAQKIGVVTKTLYNWAEENPDFLQSLDYITQEQKKRLLTEGLAGVYNPLIAKLVLSSNHGMRERTDVTSNDDKVKSIAVEIIESKDNGTQDQSN